MSQILLLPGGGGGFVCCKTDSVSSAAAARIGAFLSGRGESELSLSRVANTRPPQVHGAVQPRSEVGQDLSVIVGATVF